MVFFEVGSSNLMTKIENKIAEEIFFLPLRTLYSPPFA